MQKSKYKLFSIGKGVPNQGTEMEGSQTGIQQASYLLPREEGSPRLKGG